jgi:hypothetical protein
VAAERDTPELALSTDVTEMMLPGRNVAVEAWKRASELLAKQVRLRL